MPDSKRHQSFIKTARALLRKNPRVSAQSILSTAKAQGVGIRRREAYDVIRNIKGGDQAFAKLAQRMLKDNPNVSAEKIYQTARQQGAGIRKTVALRYIRQLKGQPEPSVEKRRQSTRRKYRVNTQSISAGESGVVEYPTRDGTIHQGQALLDLGRGDVGPFKIV